MLIIVNASAHAQPFTGTYPTRPIRIVLGIAPGGGTDIVSRAVGQKLTERWSKSVVVDNRPGASGAIAFDIVAQAAPDGHTLYIGTLSNVVSATLLKLVTYDTRKAYAPVVQMTVQPYLLIVIPSLPVKTVKDFIAYARANPDKLNYASSGNGTVSHVGMELLKSQTGITIQHIPYKGVSVGLVDMIGGQIHSMLGSALTVSYHVKSGRLRALGVSSLKRSQAWADLPTIAESGVPGFEASNSHSVFAPAGTPATIVLALNTEINRIMRTTEMTAKLAADGAEPVAGNTPEEFRKIFFAEYAKWEQYFRNQTSTP
ncbi:MAG: tripartite tricarboxylate transporter substrate binding protein [Burkholderiales bacterium]